MWVCIGISMGMYRYRGMGIIMGMYSIGIDKIIGLVIIQG